MAEVFAILGPTASGKTEVGVAVAQRLGGEVVSVDSMQVYRGMDIGTAKPSPEERQGVRHHLIDVVDPSEEFTVSEFRAMGRQVIDQAETPVIIVGGSGLHFRSLVDPMSFAPTDPDLRQTIEALDPGELVDRLRSLDPGAEEFVDLSNTRRVVRAVEVYELTGATPSQRYDAPEARDLRAYTPELEFTAVGFDPGEALDDRIALRLDRMREAGLLAEVRALWPVMGRTARGAVGYREIGAHIEGEMDLDQAFAQARRSTRKLARRQRTWFQRDPRIRWIPWSDDPEVRVHAVMEVLG